MQIGRRDAADHPCSTFASRPTRQTRMLVVVQGPPDDDDHSDA
jgi:hypothetical protein